ncbi:hypothetical protein [Salipaludibacillus sp. CF4.18]|uniref:hypothetical protein n=1 Tax=Salipaludibacillus sp. CF4.18 TaxID=3373081 RepID=UPI003EE467B1
MKKIVVSVCLIMIPVIIFGSLNMPVPMSISLFAGFACAVLINIERFDSFKAGHLEATIRQADKAIKDANATIEQLKEMTEPLMNYTLAQIVRGDHILGVGGAHKEELYKKLKRNSEQFGIKSDYNQGLLRSVERSIAETYLFEIELEVEKLIGFGKMKPIHEKFKLFLNEGIQLPSAMIIRELIKSYPSDHYNDKVENSIAEYERFLEEELGL